MVRMDDEVIELATDKVNQVLYAPKEGIFTPTVKEEDTVTIGQTIGYIEAGSGDHKEKESAQPKQEEKPAAQAEAPKAVKEPERPQTATAKDEVKAPTPAKPTEVPESKADSGHSSRKKVDEYLSEIKTDKKEASPVQREAVSTTGAQKPAVEVPETRQKMSKIRKLIATRLVEVQSTAAMLTTFNEVDLTEVMALREKYKELFAKTHDARLGFMSFFVKAAVSALKAFPGVNSYIDGDDLVQRNTYSIGIAVGSDKGLVVPVLRNCDTLSFGEIESEITTFAKKVKEGKLTANDLQGGGFTITNGGVYGSLLSTPILNPKQCAILGMHKISKRPVVVDDEIVIRPMMYLALSYDHRIIDGKEAVSFLVHIKNCLEDPSRLLLEV